MAKVRLIVKKTYEVEIDDSLVEEMDAWQLEKYIVYDRGLKPYEEINSLVYELLVLDPSSTEQK